MDWHQRRLAAFDIETTGVNCHSDRIVTAAISLVGEQRPSEEHTWLVDPGIEIPQGATAVHGVTTERARAEGMAPAEAVEQITTILANQIALGVPIIAFNARFDLTILNCEARRHGVTPLIDRVGGLEQLIVVDPFVIDKQFDRFRKGKRTLGALCEHYQVRLDEAHAAHADALAAARLAWRMRQTLPELATIELKSLHCQQAAWSDEQSASLQSYFDQKGKTERVELGWPIIPTPADWVA